jgi:hypothetical protein
MQIALFFSGRLAYRMICNRFPFFGNICRELRPSALDAGKRLQLQVMPDQQGIGDPREAARPRVVREAFWAEAGRGNKAVTLKGETAGRVAA